MYNSKISIIFVSTKQRNGINLKKEVVMTIVLKKYELGNVWCEQYMEKDFIAPLWRYGYTKDGKKSIVKTHLLSKPNLKKISERL